ncbi:hypothetical protein AURDEDRAFT_163803 [Auricularia subglabra TFB-10046 SS5]|nr:hypothetical protein AURDEDRAFT_163803 [Auricularia subglabra TFB-10046 SS5]
MPDETLGVYNVQAFPDFLLPDVLDHLSLRWLLLAAMPANRYWRETVVSHPLYWFLIQLLEDAPESATKSPSLFTLAFLAPAPSLSVSAFCTLTWALQSWPSSRSISAT